jgi:O6-methylguanine-DNA--protein-cysteine methyltransferase
MQTTTFDTALGRFGIGWTDKGLARVLLPGEAPDALLERLSRGDARPGDPTRAIAALMDRIEDYAEGEPADFRDVNLDLGCVPDFHRRAYEILFTVGWGETLTYGDLARRLGDVSLSRAVGQSHAPGHSLPSGAGQRRQARRFFSAWRSGFQTEDARLGRRVHRGPGRADEFWILGDGLCVQAVQRCGRSGSYHCCRADRQGSRGRPGQWRFRQDRSYAAQGLQKAAGSSQTRAPGLRGLRARKCGDQGNCRPVLGRA